MEAQGTGHVHVALVLLVPCHGVLDGEIEGGWWEMTLQRQQAREEGPGCWLADEHASTHTTDYTHTYA